MRSIAFIICFSLTSTIHLCAQSLSIAQSYLYGDEISSAIPSIEKIVYGMGSDNPEAWMLMYKIFKKAETTSPYNSFPDDCISRQHEAISKLMKLPGTSPSSIMEREFGKDFKYIYNKFYSEFVTFAQKSVKSENYGAAYKNYKRALKVYEDIYTYGLDTSPLDTTLTFHTGFNALKAEKYEETEKYFRILADANIVQPKFELIYSWLVKYYILEKKDMQLAAKMLEKGLRYYPEDKELNELKAYLTPVEGGN